MDFGQLGLDTFFWPNSSSDNCGFPLENAAEINKQKCYGFGCLTQDRAVSEDDLRGFKLAKTSSASCCGGEVMKFPLQRSNGGGEGRREMVSFASPNSQAVSLPYYQQTPNGFCRNTVSVCRGGINSGSMQGVRGPFTPSQWMELEHQALIYKYITANIPIPSYLLNPITKAFQSAGFPGLRSTLGWGGFRLGFPAGDPEPGRCRRTDGKKWRCSREAVADQKYCERHMNRGRHRSRKPVEGQSGPSASAPTATNGRSSTPSEVPAGGVSDSLSLSHHVTKLHPPPNSIPLSGKTTINRSLLDKENNDVYSAHKQHNGHQESSQQEFGLVYSDSLLNPLNTSPSLVSYKNYGASDNLKDHENRSNDMLRQFTDDWPMTQLSISIPTVASDFMSCTSSPTNEKLTGLEMGLGVGSTAVSRAQRLTNWAPISWEPTMGGPLGEVLHTTSNGSPRLALSPTGVLQRGAFVSLSNSSAASSPRADRLGPYEAIPAACTLKANPDWLN